LPVLNLWTGDCRSIWDFKIMKNRFTIIIVLTVLTSIFLSSCSTKQLLVKSVSDKPGFDKGFVVLANDSSLHLPLSFYPNHESINGFIIKKEPAHVPIDSLICSEIKKHGFECSIVEMGGKTEPDKYTILYQDYWAWDFKLYMHVLKIWVYYNNKEIIKVVSEGNTAGMHDFPTPENQVPKLVNLIMKQQ